MPDEGKPLGSAYILHEPLGSGAWGEVWRGSERASGGAVAIKILRPELARDPQLVSRFLMERSMLVDVRHPNLVSVRDLVAEGGNLAIVMDLVEGGDLHYLIQRRGILDPREACGLLAGIASALATVHAAGIVHSDVKPANILVDERFSPPRARVTDFGLAALAGTTGRGPTGTPEYMAPELASGGGAIAATDLYACGVVMYEAVTGVLPFDTGGDISEMLRSHVEEPVPRPPHLQNDVWEVIRSLLAKWPGSRPTAAQLAERLTALATGATPAMVRPAPSPPPAPSPVADPRPAGRGPLPLPLPLEELLARAQQAAEMQAARPALAPEPAAPVPAAVAVPPPVAVAPPAPIQAPIQAPVQPPSQGPVQAPVQAPVPGVEQAAVREAVQAPVQAPVQAAVQAFPAPAPVAPPAPPAPAPEPLASAAVPDAIVPQPLPAYPPAPGAPIGGAPATPVAAIPVAGTEAPARPAQAAETSATAVPAPAPPARQPAGDGLTPEAEGAGREGDRIERVTRAGDRRDRRPAPLTPLPGQGSAALSPPPAQRAAAPLTPLPGQIPAVPGSAALPGAPPSPEPAAPLAAMNPLPSHRAPMARPPKAPVPRQAPPTPLPLPGPKAEKAPRAPAGEAPVGPGYADLFPGLGDKPAAPRKPAARGPEPEEALPDIEAVLATAPPLAAPVKRPPKAAASPPFKVTAERTSRTKPERTGGPAGLRSRLPVLALVAGVIIAVVIAAIVANHRSTTLSTNAGGSTYHFPAASYPGPVSVQRTWSLSASGVLSGQVVITNASSAAGVTYDEVIPKSVAARAGAVTFQPAPATVVQEDPVVEYAFPGLAPGGSVTVSYTARVTAAGSAASQLAALAADQRAAETGFQRPSATSASPKLASLYASASPTAIKVGGTAHLTVTGTMSDGSPASATILQGVIWSEAPTGIVVVSGSTAQGAAPGITKLTATDAGTSSSFGMAVTPDTSPAAPATSHAPVTTPTRATGPSPSPTGPAQAACIQAQAPPEPSPVSGTVTSEPVYRLCDPRTGFRLYTTSPVEWSTLAGMGDVNEPADGYVAMQQDSGLVPLYRLTDSEGRQFLATTSQAMSSLEAQGAGVPQVLGYVPATGGLPIYGASTPQYGAVYTTDAGEHSRLVGAGWHDQGVVGTVFSTPQ